MIEFPITLTSGGSVCLPGHAYALALGYTKNRGVYRLAVTASGEWEGLTIRAFWHVPDGKEPASSLVEDGYVAVPASVTAQPGSGCITFEGSDGAKVMTSADLRYRVSANSGTEDGTPTPDAPVPIVSAGDGGSLTVKVTGKNRMPPNLKYQEFVECFVKKNTPITLVFKGDLVSQGGNILFYDENNNQYWFGIDKGKAEHHIKYPVDLTKFQYLISNMASENMCLTWNASSPDYEPYREQLLTLPTPNGLPGIPVTSGGNYADSTGQQWVCDEVDLERGVRVQRVGKTQVNTKNGTPEETHRLRIPFSGNGKSGNFDCIISVTPFTSWTSCVNDRFLYLKNVPKSDGSFYTGEELLALAIDVDFVYQLATPIETPLTPDELSAYKALAAYAPDTVVQAGDGAGIKLDYQRDVNLVVKNLEDAIASMTTT